MAETFYSYQQRRLAVLLGWGLGSVVGGLLGAPNRAPLVRQFALQAAAWGAVNSAIAVLGIRGVRKAAQGENTTGEDQLKAAQGFRKILAINAVLDVGYVLGGVLLARRYIKRSDRVGTGLGIVLQGIFLFLYDAILTLDVGRWMSRSK